MQKLRLPRTDIVVSRLAFGCWGLTSDFHWGAREESESIGAIHAAIDAGIDFFDTAPMYADGASERLLGKALAGRRDRVVLASKVKVDAMRPADLERSCDDSLARLGTDRLDLYQTHWFADRGVPIADTWGAMLELVRKGKARAVGVCNAGPGDLDALGAIQAPVVDQLPYNLLFRAIETAILPRCRERDIAVLAYSPLQHALLAGKYESAAAVPDGRARSRHFGSARPLTRHGEPGCEAETFAAIGAVEAIARDLARPVSEVALAWLLARPGVTCVIAGARNAAQAKANAAAVARPLDAEAVARLDRATDALRERLGPNPDMWQSAAGSRFR